MLCHSQPRINDAVCHTANWSINGASDHCHTLAGGTPILALDMYEHSYHIDFGAKAGSYVDIFMDWPSIDRALDASAGYSRSRATPGS